MPEPESASPPPAASTQTPAPAPVPAPTRPPFWRRLRNLFARPQKPEWYLTFVGAIIGLLTALGAIGFDRSLHWMTHEAMHIHARWGLWTLLAVPMAGAVVTGMLVFFFAREAGGHGVPQVLDAIIRRGGRLPARIGIVKVLASVCTVGTGGSAGTEGPIIQIGAVAGSVLARRMGIPREHITTMVGCGAAAGLSAIFNAPIAGVFFALEILLRDFSLRTFTPVVIASVFSTALTQVVRGSNDPIFPFEITTNYVFSFSELPAYLVLGFICAVVAVGVTQLLHFFEDVFDRLPIHPILMPILGAGLLGLMGVLYTALIDHNADLPAFFGNGYETIRLLISPRHYGGGGAGPNGEIPFLIFLMAAKAVATSLTLGSRGSGGVFAPSLFAGACVGAAFGILLNRLGIAPAHATPAGYALVGMAAVVAGSTFAPLTAILLLFEMTREPLVLAPIMLAAVVSTGAARALMPDSIYTFRLRQAGLLVGSGRDLTLLRRIRVSGVEATPLPREPVYASDPLSKLITLHAHHNVPDFVVVDAEGKYIGMVTGEDMRTALIDREAIPLLLVAELLRTDIPTVRPDETLDIVMDRFARHDVSSLCLVDPRSDEPRALLTRTRVLARYQKALDES